jgi:hypothetical protein
LFSAAGYAQEGYISPEHREKIDRRSSREIKTYQGSEYRVYGSELSLAEAIPAYYEYHFTEIADGVRKYATPTAMSREKDLAEAVEVARLNAKNSALGLMQLYFYSWINVDERTTQEQKDRLIQATEKAEPAIRDMINALDPIASFVLYKELKRDFRVEMRTVYDQELLKRNIRTLIIGELGDPDLFRGQDLVSLLTFEK